MSQAFPLSAAQLGIWLGQQMAPENPCYWTAEFIELKGTLQTTFLQQSIFNAIAESEALHMRFQHQGETIWQQASSLFELDEQIQVFSHLPIEEAWQHAHAWMQSQLQSAAVLNQDQLWYSCVLRLQPDLHVWFLRAHHIVLDGFGFALVMRRVAAWYSSLVTGSTPATRPLQPFEPVINADRDYQRSPEFLLDQAFWLDWMRGQPQPARLAPLTTVADNVIRERDTINLQRMQQWQRAARLQGIDWLGWLAACIALWLYDLTGKTAITLGIPVMNRLGSPALGVPCMHMNIVPLPIRLDPQQHFIQLARHVDSSWRSIRPHTRYRYEQLKQDLNLAGNQRLFGPVLNLMPFDRPLNFANLKSQSHPLAAGPVEDLAINIIPHSTYGLISLEANPNAHTLDALNNYMHSLLHMLDTCAQHSNQPIHTRIPGYFRASVLLKQEKLTVDATHLTLRILQQALRHPERIALTTPNQRDIRYSELLARVQALAGVLAGNGVMPHQRIAIYLPSSADAIVAILAVLWTGATYIPLDPNGPQERQHCILAHAQPHWILCRSDNALENCEPTQSIRTLLVDQISQQVPIPLPMLNPRTVDENIPAYMIYTSGSTGTPNGVIVSFAALNHFIAATTQRYGVHSNDRILQFSPLHFDASIEEIFLSLCNGATLALRTQKLLDIQQLVHQCEQQRISVLDLPTAYWHELVYALAHSDTHLPDSIRIVIIGGEAAQPAAVALWQKNVGNHVSLINTYGPTEATVVCTSASITNDDGVDATDEAVTIGSLLPGLSGTIVDSDLQPVNPGEAGELCVFGPTLAMGYWQNAELTAQRFVQLNWLPEQPRAYRTGDQVTLNAKGEVRYLGRKDDELKISGHRVSLTAVEAVLSSHPGIRECAVIASRQGNMSQLIAFLVLHLDTDHRALKQWLTFRLLPAAIPGHFLTLTQFPKNANNKVDRKALLALWQLHKPDNGTDQIRTLNPLESAIADIWLQILGVKPQSPEDDFFEMGGKSLQAIQVMNRLSEYMQRTLPASLLFKHSSLGGLAEILDAATTQKENAIALQQDPLAPTIVIQEGKGAPLFCIHPVDGLSWCYCGLSQSLPELTIIGLQAPALSGRQPDNFADLIQHYIKQIRNRQACGPYRLLGWSYGGGIAHAIASELQASGDTVEHLFLMDAYPADHWRDAPPPTRTDAILTLLDDITQAHDSHGKILSERELIDLLQTPGSTLAAFSEATLQKMVDSTLVNMNAYRTIHHPTYCGDIQFFRANQRAAGQPEWQSWQAYVNGNIRVTDIDSNHFGLHHPRPLRHIGRVIAHQLNNISSLQLDFA